MKVGTVVNIMTTYYEYQKRIRNAKFQYNFYDVYGDKEGMKEMQDKINEEKKNLGQFLDLEI